MTQTSGPVMILMVGPAGSGKSTYVRENFPGYAVLNADSIRLDLTGDESNQERNPEVFSVMRRRLAKFLRSGQSAVVDNTNVKQPSRTELYEIAKAFDARIEAHVMQTDLAMCLRRNAGRTRVVPDDVIKNQYVQFLQSLSELPCESQLDSVVLVEP